MSVSQTSLAAYQALRPVLSRRQSQVWAMLRVVGPTNNRILAEALDWPINRVTGRVCELDAAGMVRWIDTVVDPGTGKAAKVWEAVR